MSSSLLPEMGLLMSAVYELTNNLQRITWDGSPEAARLAIMASPSQDLQSVLKGREDFHMASAIHSAGQNQSFYF